MTRLLGAAFTCLAFTFIGCGGGGGGGAPAGPVITTTEAAVDITAGTVVLATQPTNYTVTGTATDDGGGNATVNLAVTSTHSRLVFNLKAVVTAITDGAVTAGNTYQGDRYFYFGPGALEPGGMQATSVTISGLAGTSFLLTLDWVDHPMAFVPGSSQAGDIRAVDSSGTGEQTSIDIDAFGYDGNSGVQDGFVSPDGRFLYVGLRNQPAILAIDLVTLSPVLSADLTGQADLQTDATGSIGFTGGVVMSPGGEHLYVAYTRGMHASASIGNSGDLNGAIAATTTCSIVKLDRASLVEIDRVDLLVNDMARPQAKSILISASGNRLAVPLMEVGLVAVVEASDLTVLDGDPMTMGTQHFDVSGFSDHPRRVALDATGARVYVSHGTNAARPSTAIQRIDVGPATVTTLGMGPQLGATAVGDQYPADLRVGPDGRVYLASAYQEQDPAIPGLAILDPDTMMWSELLPDVSPNAMAFDASGRLILYHNPGGSPDRFYVLDTSTDTLVAPEAMPGTDYIPVTVDGYGHLCAISPF